MMKVNLIGDYGGSERVSGIEWVSMVVNTERMVCN